MVSKLALCPEGDITSSLKGAYCKYNLEKQSEERAVGALHSWHTLQEERAGEAQSPGQIFPLNFLPVKHLGRDAWMGLGGNEAHFP